jgi:enterochelin esterase-like enzyme
MGDTPSSTHESMSRYPSAKLSSSRRSRDALQVLSLESEALRGHAEVTVFVPPGQHHELPLVLLLHGVYGNHFAWANNGGAHRTAARLIERGLMRPMVLAMPADGIWGGGEGYARHRHGDYESWIMEEVVGSVSETLPELDLDPPLFLAGLSMGGYAALRLGAKYGRRILGISAHSAMTYLTEKGRFLEDPQSGLQADKHSVGWWLMRNRAALAPLRFDCGTEDPLIEANRRLHADLTAHGVTHRFQEFPGYHSWDYWALHLPDTLLFFEDCLRRAAAAAARR